MTALTIPARPKRDAGLRPMPWRRMAWVTWRQHRIALAGVAALLAALAVYLWLSGLQMHHSYAAACHPASSLDCAINFTGRYGITAVIVSIFLQAVPALIGAFAGAPVLARELETGTFRFAWTQGFARWRWALAKLVALAVVLAAVTGAFSVLVSWCYQPFSGAGNQDLGIYGNSALVTVFSLRAVTFPAWTVAAFANANVARRINQQTPLASIDINARLRQVRADGLSDDSGGSGGATNQNGGADCSQYHLYRFHNYFGPFSFRVWR